MSININDRKTAKTAIKAYRKLPSVISAEVQTYGKACCLGVLRTSMERIPAI